jgi:hypothetical protein
MRQARLELGPIASLRLAIDLDAHEPSTGVPIGGHHRHVDDVNTSKMAVERAGNIQRSLNAGFLTFVVMYEQKNVFHHSSSDSPHVAGPDE